jgi:glycerol-3-phosphate O-acyltransferase
LPSAWSGWDPPVTDEKAFLRRCVAVGQQWLLQRRITSAEAVSMVRFESALDVARNRSLIEADGDVEDRRRELKAYVRDTIGRAHIVRHHAIRQALDMLAGPEPIAVR